MDHLLNLLSLADRLGHEASSPEALLDAFLPRLLTANTGIIEAVAYRLGTTALSPWASAGTKKSPTPKPLMGLATTGLTPTGSSHSGPSIYEQALASDAPIHDGQMLLMPLRMQSTALGILTLRYAESIDLTEQNDQIVNALAQHLALHLEQKLTNDLLDKQHIATVALNASESVSDVAKALSNTFGISNSSFSLYVLRWVHHDIDSLHKLEIGEETRYTPITSFDYAALKAWHKQWINVADAVWYRHQTVSDVTDIMRKTMIPAQADSAYILPLRYGQQILAIAVCSSDKALALTTSERFIRRSIAEKAAIVLRQLLWDTQQVMHGEGEDLALQLHRMQEITEYSKIVQSATKARNIMKSTLSILFRLMDVQYAAICLFNHHNYKLELRAERYFEAITLDANEAITPETHTPARDAWTQQIMCKVDNLQQTSDIAHPQRHNLTAIMATPIQGRTGYNGVLEVGSTKTLAFSKSDIMLLHQIANPLGIALANVASLEVSARRATIKSLANDIKSRIQRQTDMDTLMQVTVEELTKALSAQSGRIRLGVEPSSVMKEDA